MTQFRYIQLCTPAPTGGCTAHGSACPTPGKRPVVADWANAWTLERPSGTNAGILTGPESGLLVIDVDTPEALDTVKSWGLPETFTVKSGRVGGGLHYYFRWPEGLERVPNRLDGVEVKGPGRQVVAWDSLHASGRRYEKIGGGLAHLPQSFVERLRGSTAQHSLAEVSDVTPEGQRLLDAFLAVLPDAVELRDGNWEATCPAHNDHDPSLVVTASDKLLVCCRAGCTYSEILAALDWAPPAPTFDPLEGITWRRVEGGAMPAEYHWEQDDAGDWILVPVGQVEAAPGRLQRRWNGAELAASSLPPIQTLPLLGRPGYLGKGLSNLVAAFPKVGKTTLLQAFLRETLDAGMHVLYFSEEGPDLWKGRLHGAPASWAGLDLVCAMGTPVNELLDILRESAAQVVVVDTLRSVIGWDDENDNAKVAAAVTPWIVGCREGRKTLIGLHHATKAGGQFGRGIAGGHALFGAFDQAVEIERVGEQRRVRTFGRIGAVDDMLYEMVDGRLQLASSPLGTLDQSDGRAIIEALKLPHGAEVPTPLEMQSLTGLSKGRVEKARAWLTDAGWIKTPSGKKPVWQVQHP